MTQRLSIGFGSSSVATCADILDLIRTHVPELGSEVLLATVDRRAAVGERVANSLRLKLVLFPASVLSGTAGVESASARALEAIGTASVAEAAALAALGPAARLLLPRRSGRHCTCAVAVLP